MTSPRTPVVPEGAGRLVQVGRGRNAYSAFVPNPLPPSLPFDSEIVKALSEADRALGELAGLGRSLPNPHLLIRPFIHREAVLSSRIEGTQASIDDLYAYESGQLELPGLKKMRHPDSDVREVLNYVRALEYGLERLATLPVSLRFIRELHERLMEGVRSQRATPGEFRARQNWIGAPDCTLAEATFVPPPVDEMHQALDSFEKYLHTEDVAHPPLMRLAFIHYQFEAIHPFLDGNGRIGRLLISLLLIHWDLLPRPLLYLSAFFEHRRQEYYELLLGVSDRGAWRDWVTFFLSGIGEQALDAVQRIKQLQNLQADWCRQVEDLRPGILLRVVDYLFERPVLSAADLQKRFDVSHPTAILALQRLEDRKILREISGKRRGRLYAATRIFEVLAD